MTIADTEGDGSRTSTADSIDSLGDSNWRARQAAVDRLIGEGTPQLVSQIVERIRTGHRDLSQLNASIQVLTRIEADILPELLPLLTNADADLRAYVALILGERGDARAIPALIDALSDSNINVQVHSIEALGKLRTIAAVDPLIALVESGKFELAFPALDALVAIGDERIGHRLVPLVQDPLLGSAAVEAMGTLGDEDAVVPLLGLLADNAVSPVIIAKALHKIYVRQATRYGGGDAIVNIVRHASVPANVETLKSLISGTSIVDSAAIVSVIGWIRGDEADAALLDVLDSPELRRHVFDALVTRGPSIISALSQRFQRSPTETQLGLIEICGRLGDRSTVPLLLECLQHDDDEIVAKTLDALGRIGDERVYESAKALLRHQSAHVRQAAVGVLNSLGHPATSSDMRQLLNDPTTIAREGAIKVAAYFGFPECVESLLACCDHPDGRIQRVAIEHLACLNDDRVVERLARAMQSESAELRSTAARALGEIPSDTTIRILEDALGDGDVWVRYFAVRSLAEIDFDNATAQRRLSLAKDDPAMQVRIAAVETLGAEALAELVELAGSPEEDLAAAALAALGATRDPAALLTLTNTLNSDNPRQQLESIRALGQTGLVLAVEPLSRTANSRDHRLSESAIEALARIPREESVDALLQVVIIPERRDACVAALISMGDIVIPTLARRLHLLVPDARRAVIAVLIGIHSPQACEVLETALNDPEPAVRFSALSALAHVRVGTGAIADATGRKGNA